MEEGVMRTESSEPSRARLTTAGVTRIVTVVSTLVLIAGIFFAAAGTLEVGRAWIYYGALLTYLTLATAVIFVRFPDAIETVNARGRFNKDVKSWDKLFGLCYTLLLLVLPAVAGWDVRVGRSFEVPWPLLSLALAVTLLGYAFVHWAMIVNTHAETGVRIQSERHHEVVSSGPYRIVRHPFYISMIVVQLVCPLALGSPSAFIPAVLLAIALVWRTAREDETLRCELEGYEAFTRQTRYRLFPGVW
jgi:protein-S-isoprenylcysteine O-methyltransferase Ste14